MKRRINPFWVIYLIFIFLPLATIFTLITAIVTIIMSGLFGDSKWGYYPGKIWSNAMCFISFVKIRTIGHSLYDRNKSYIFWQITKAYTIYGSSMDGLTHHLNG